MSDATRHGVVEQRVRGLALISSCNKSVGAETTAYSHYAKILGSGLATNGLLVQLVRWW